MKRRIVLLLLLAVVACAAAAVTAFLVIKKEVDRQVTLAAPVTVEVKPGESLKKVAASLRQAGLIESERIFLAAAWWQGADRNIKHGRHDFEGTVTLPGLLEELGRAPRPLLRVTIPEGLTLREIAALLEGAGATSAEAYRAVACSEELKRLVAAPATASCAEGYLFPDTYDLVPGMSAGTIVDLQVKRFHEVADPLLSSAADAAAGGPDAAARALTLASIVEKETADGSERPRIAAVFYNRLKLGMPLQTDPTVIYGVIDSGSPWDGNLTRAHLETPNPYNTYMVKGLPPGPICNPGRAAIEAAVHPAESRELYFVARGDGSHEFSTNLADHNRAVRRYQLH